jgi:hypothetical protein
MSMPEQPVVADVDYVATEIGTGDEADRAGVYPRR